MMVDTRIAVRLNKIPVRQELGVTASTVKHKSRRDVVGRTKLLDER
jgi:hypothetical protein